MNIYLFDDDKIITLSLPYKKIGNFWLTDSDDKNIINITGVRNEWILSGSENTSIEGADTNGNITMHPKKYYTVIKDDKKYVVFANYASDNSYEGYKVKENQTIKIGSGSGNEISTSIPCLSDIHIAICYANNRWRIQKNANSIAYINSEVMENDVINVNNGNTINIFGLNISLIKEVLFINNPLNDIKISANLTPVSFTIEDQVTNEEIENKELYSDSDYYLKSPRMKRDVVKYEIKFDAPPGKEVIQEIPIWVTLGPMLTMAASSVVTLTTSLTAIAKGEKSFGESIPTLLISLCLIISMFVWPFVTRKYQKQQKISKEKARQERYKEYLSAKQEELYKELFLQKKIMEENLIETSICYDMITNKRRTLWGRKKEQSDFLTVRIGKGQVPFNAHISYTNEDFSMEDDNLKRALQSIVKKFDFITDVPIGFSFSDNYLTAISGVYPKYVFFVNNMILQLMSFYSYDDLKIVILTNKKNKKRWEYLKESPYCFSDDKGIRYFATDEDEMLSLSEYLDKVFENRKVLSKNGNNDERIKEYTKFKGYYVLIVDDINTARKMKIVENILSEKTNLAFSLVVIEEKLSKIPSEVSNIFTIGDSASVVIKSEDNSQIRFTDEINDTYDMELCSKILSNLPLYIDGEERKFPNSISFLELFSVGQVDQLNVLSRWKKNDPTKSLKTEIGVNDNNDPFILDIHEKYHGPHGLIAGMTGSGKSEFIISYILSMAVNYSPEEVAFVLIDYKGGGLAGAFKNDELKIKLPHVVGTITNLDKAEINRALSSINSELRRRQARFNDARDKIGESSVDIYKYQKLYREGIIDEPMPHLIIISDEFAELKDQQPDFMEDLVSTARIGRSLGVHLILATQKPSGVVDGQIWSNSKFKICLKVQDKQDSMEMIKNDLAAEIKNVGRFYLQVGYNEYFATGQAAWAGAQYYPSKEFKKPVDKNIYFIDNIGSINSMISNTLSKKLVKSEGEELTNIVKYLIDISKESPNRVKQLWLDRIPNVVLLNTLLTKYSYAKEKFIINPILGEYDNPFEQMQGLLTLPVSRDGNVVVYGTSDSGKDEFLSTLVYSLIMTYDTSELNLYLLDYGAETLMNFQDAPQVGNVILNGDDEKLENLAKMLTSEMNKRKKLFMSYNGNYQDYIKMCETTVPNILVIINSIEVLTEVYQDYIDKIIPIIREGSKFGIYFVVTTNSQTTIKFKVSQSCKQIICLQLNKESDYRDILGKTDGLVPFGCLGRGLIKLDRVCEFQTASIVGEDNSFMAIKDLISLLNKKEIKQARSIPVMPDIITSDRFDDKYKGINTFPLGLERENLTASLYDYSNSVINLISSNDMENMRAFLNNFMKEFEKGTTFNKIVIDATNYFEGFDYKVNYLYGKFNEVVDALKKTDEEIQDIYNKNNMNIRVLKTIPATLCVIVGLGKFYEKLDEDHKKIFKEILDHNRETLRIIFIFIDVPGSFKKYEYDEWYKLNVNSNEGLWIGSGITQQFVIKINIQVASINLIENEYGVVVKNGMPTVIKLINEIKKQ